MTEKVTGTVRSLTPVAAKERLVAIDVLRGFALLGILTINIDFFALPGTIYFDPTSAGDLSGLNRLAWSVGMVLFESKMMAIFSMLFGAGLILMYSRAKSAGKPFAAIYYRRLFWLLMIGLAHAYLVWVGDILVSYAICGFCLYPLLGRSVRSLFILGTVALVVGALIKLGSGFSFELLQAAIEPAQAKLESGEAITLEERGYIDQWEELRRSFQPLPHETEQEIEAYRSGYLDVVRFRAPQTLMMQTQALLFWTFWRVSGLMLIGMALMKLGVFSASLSKRFYVALMVGGFGLGLPLAYIGMSQSVTHGFDFVQTFQADSHFNYFGSILVALGYVGLLLLVYKNGWLSWLTKRLAAVGRTALSNYLLQSIICTTIFYGYGFGLFARVDRFALQGIVLVIWIIQLTLSPIWLARFRFGPAEWLWRSLTYWKLQPMAVAKPAACSLS